MKSFSEFFKTKLVREVVVDFQCVHAIVISFFVFAIFAIASG